MRSRETGGPQREKISRKTTRMWFWGSAGFASGAFKDAVSHHGSSKQDFFTEGHLQDLFDALHAFDTIDDRNRDAAVEILRQIAELLVWGERHKNEAFFDIFCEQNILSYFVDIVSQPRVANAVKVQLLQTLSILVQNTHRKTAIYYLFSNNYINTLLRTPYDFSNEELVAWYVSFIKGLSLLVNHDTVKLFLNKRAPSFPVFSEAVKFFVHRDSMVRTHVRTVTLSIFKIREPVVEEFLVRHSAFFSHIACYLRAQWAERCRGLRACRRLSPRYHASTTTSTSSRSAASASPCGRDTPGTAACVAALKSGFSECEEFLFYIQDIFGIGVEAYNTLLVERLLLYTYLPLLVGCLCRGAPRETTVRRFAFPDAEPTSTVSTPGGGDWGRSGTQGPFSLARRLTRDPPSSASSSRNFRRRSREVLSSPMSVPLGSFPSSQRPSMPPSSSAPLSQTLSPATSRSRPRRKYPCPAPSQAFSPASFSPSHSSSYSSSPCSPLSSSPSSSAASLPSLPASSVAPSLSSSASFLSKRGERGDTRSSPDALRPRHRWRSKSVGRQATPADAGEFLLASSNRGNAGDLLYTRGGRAVPRAQAERDQSSPRRGEARGETEPSEEESDKAEARRGELGKKAHGRRGRRHDAGEQEGEGDASPERRGVADVPPKRRPRRLRGPAELELVMTPLTGQTSRRGTAEEDPTTETEASREEPAEREAETHAKKGNARRLSRSRAKTETPGFVQKRNAKPGSEEAVASERTRHVEWRRRRERERGSLRDSGKREARGASVPVSFASCASTDDACEGPQTADDTPQVVALYLLIQSFTTIQHPDLLRPVLALLLLPRVPESLLRLCAAHLPPTPASYVALESPAQCAGRVELFLPDESADAAGAVEDENEAASRWRGCKPPQGGGEAGRERRNSAVIRADGEIPQTRGLKRELGSGASATTTANRPTGRAEGDPLRSRERETLVNGREEKETEGKREERRDEETNEEGGEKNLTPTLTDAEHEEFEGSTLSRSASASRPPLFASFSFERGGRSPAERASKEADSRRRGDARKRFSLSTGRTKEAASSSLPARASKIENAFVNASTASKAFRCTRASSGVSITGGVSTTGGVSALEASGEKGRTRDGEETSFLKRHDGHRGLQCGGFCSSGTEQEEGVLSFPSAAQRDFGTCPSLSASAVLATRRPLLQKAQKEIQRAFEENLFFSLCSEDVSSPISRCQSRSESHARQTVSAVWGGLGEGAGDGERGSEGCREGDSEGREEQPRRSGHWASEMRAEGRRPSWGSSGDSFPEEDEDTVWVTNPYRRALEYFVGAEAASRRRRDTAVLLGGALLHAVLSHPTVTSVFLQNAGLLPSLRPARGRRALQRGTRWPDLDESRERDSGPGAENLNVDSWRKSLHASNTWTCMQPACTLPDSRLGMCLPGLQRTVITKKLRRMICRFPCSLLVCRPRFRRSMSPESSYGDRVLASASCVPLSAFASAASSSFTAPSPRPASSSSLTSSSSAPPFSTLHARLSSFVSLPSRAEMETEERESPRGADADSAGKGTPTVEAGALEEKDRLEDPKTTKKDAEEPQAAGREARGNKQREERREEDDASELQEEARTPRAQDSRKTAEGSEEEDAKETRLRACGKCRDDRLDSRPGNQFRIACRWSLLKALLDAVQQNAHETFMRPVTVTLVCRVASLCVLSVLGRLGVSSLSPVVSSTRVSGSGKVGTRRKRFLLLRLLDEGLRRLSCKVKDLRKAATASVQLALMDADTHAHADGGFANPDNSHCPVALFWEEWESVKNAPPFDSGALSRDARMLLPAAVAGMSSQGGSGARSGETGEPFLWREPMSSRESQRRAVHEWRVIRQLCKEVERVASIYHQVLGSSSLSPSPLRLHHLAEEASAVLLPQATSEEQKLYARLSREREKEREADACSEASEGDSSVSGDAQRDRHRRERGEGTAGQPRSEREEEEGDCVGGCSQVCGGASAGEKREGGERKAAEKKGSRQRDSREGEATGEASWAGDGSSSAFSEGLDESRRVKISETRESYALLLKKEEDSKGNAFSAAVTPDLSVGIAGVLQSEGRQVSVWLEGRNFIRCFVDTQEGLAPRYFLQSETHLLLVSPSPETPGRADVRMACPLAQVESRVDSTDTSRLRLLVASSATPPGDAVWKRSSNAGDQLPERRHSRSSSFSTDGPMQASKQQRSALKSPALQVSSAAGAVLCHSSGALAGDSSAPSIPVATPAEGLGARSDGPGSSSLSVLVGGKQSGLSRQIASSSQPWLSCSPSPKSGGTSREPSSSAHWELHLSFEDTLRCCIVAKSIQEGRSKLRAALRVYIDRCLEDSNADDSLFSAPFAFPPPVYHLLSSSPRARCSKAVVCRGAEKSRPKRSSGTETEKVE